MGWNGYDLVTDMANLNSDTSPSGRIKVLGYLNFIIMDICAYHEWAFLRQKGQILMDTDTDEQDLLLNKPSAPTVGAVTGGSLDNGTYSMKVSFYESVADIESQVGDASDDVVIDTDISVTDKTIDLSDIPVSVDPLVTARKVYLKKDDEAYILYSTMSDNTTTVLSITENTTTNLGPTYGDYDYIQSVDGPPFMENSNALTEKSISQLRLLFSGDWSNSEGKPNLFSMLHYTKIITYPRNNTNDNLSFYYFKNPKKLYDDAESIPTIPIWLRETLESGTDWRGYQYKDRSGKIEARNVYLDTMQRTISRKGSPIKSSKSIRDVVGSSEGYELQ